MPNLNTYGYQDIDHAPGAGFIGEGTPYITLSFTAEGDIPFGSPVVEGVNPATCVRGAMGLRGIHPEKFLGVAVRDNAAPQAGDDKYVEGDEVTVLMAGVVYLRNVDTTAAVAGNNVGITTGGMASFTSDTASNLILVGAIWLDDVEEDEIGRAEFINTAQGRTAPIGGTGTPTAPRTLTATASSSSQIDLAWLVPTDNGDSAISGYRIWRSENGLSFYVLVSDTGDTNLIYDDTGLSPGSQHWYRVAAINAQGVGLFSNDADDTTDTTAPSAPRNVIATAVSDTEIRVDWETPATDGADPITGYRVERSTDGTTYTTLTTVGVALTHTDTGLTQQTRYYYRVVAINSTGDSTESAPADTTTLRTPVVPTAPTGLMATASGPNAIVLSWTAPSDDGGRPITGYQIESSDDNSVWADLVANTGTQDVRYVDNTVTPTSTRYYRVYAINVVGTGPVSNEANATTPAVPMIPEAPENLTATAVSSSQIDLAWDAPNSNGGSAITGYRIDISSDGVAYTTLVDTQVARSYNHTGLPPNTRVHYRVYALNAIGTSAMPDSADATTAIGVPGAPQNLTATPNGQNRIDLTWDAPVDTGGATITGYRVDGSDDGVSFTTLSANNVDTSYSNTGLMASQTRYYRVYSINSAHTSTAYAEANATTSAIRLPSVPQTFTATAVSDTQIDLVWTAPSDLGGTGITVVYFIERSDDPNGPFAGIANQTSLAYSDMSLMEGTRYYYRVYARNSAGDGPAATADAETNYVVAQYVSLKATSDFVEADFLDPLGVAFARGSNTATAPILAGDAYMGLARRASLPAPSYLDINRQNFNQFGGLTAVQTTVSISGEDYNVWYTTHALALSGVFVEFR